MISNFRSYSVDSCNCACSPTLQPTSHVCQHALFLHFLPLILFFPIRFQSESEKLSNERDKALSGKTLAEVKLEEERHEFQAKLEGHSRNLAELARAMQLKDSDPDTNVLDPKRLPYQLEDLLSDMHHVQVPRRRGT